MHQTFDKFESPKKYPNDKSYCIVECNRKAVHRFYEAILHLVFPIYSFITINIKCKRGSEKQQQL